MDDTLQIIGDNKYGQLSTPPSELPFSSKLIEIKIKEKVKALHAMSESFIVQGQFDKLYTWGWNEHGNLGLGDIKDRFEPTEIPLEINPG